ncbi:MAG: hypothetical protein MRJ94_07560 [Nitrospirales bacterium]|nr:hypothetical protein [Nitrospirales bacterium]
MPGAVIEPTAGQMMLGDDIIYDDGWKVKDLRVHGPYRLCIPGAVSHPRCYRNVALLPMLAGKPNAEARKRAIELFSA